MPRTIVILVLTSAFVITVYSEDKLKCYMCTSLSNGGCGSNFITKLQPKECTYNNIIDWQRSIEQHNNLSKIVRPVFEIDEKGLYHGASQNMACAKLILNNAKQNVVIRKCQLAKVEYTDSCKMMREAIGHLDIKMEDCIHCFKDACNSTMFLSSEIFYIFFSFFCTLAAFYRWA